MSKNLDELNASKAGISQAELESAYLSLGTLEQELAEADAALSEALTAKLAAQEAEMMAKAAALAANNKRDPIYEEWQRADWIVRNADPDQPIPPTGMVPPRIKSVRMTEDG